MNIEAAVTKVIGNHEWSYFDSAGEWLSMCYTQEKMSPEQRAEVEAMVEPEHFKKLFAIWAISKKTNKKRGDRQREIHAGQGGHCYGSRCGCIRS